MICAKTDNKAMELAEDMKWMREKWVVPFGQPFPELLFGSPETLNKRIEDVTKRIPVKEILSSLELFSEKVIKNFN